MQSYWNMSGRLFEEWQNAAYSNSKPVSWWNDFVLFISHYASYMGNQNRHANQEWQKLWVANGFLSQILRNDTECAI